MKLKKILSAVLAVSMMAAVTGCGGNTDTTTTDQTGDTAQAADNSADDSADSDADADVSELKTIPKQSQQLTVRKQESPMRIFQSFTALPILSTSPSTASSQTTPVSLQVGLLSL